MATLDKQTGPAMDCSGGMTWAWNTFLHKDPPWEECCHAHDLAYWEGGSAAKRLEADRKLRDCVAATGHPAWARIMYLAVRLFGGPHWPWPKVRWQYAYKYKDSYRYLR